MLLQCKMKINCVENGCEVNGKRKKNQGAIRKELLAMSKKKRVHAFTP